MRCLSSIARMFVPALVVPALVHAGEVSYEAPGNFRCDEGTIEVWFTPTVDDLYPEPNGAYQQVFTLFNMTVPDTWRMSCTWYARPSRKGLKMSMGSQVMKKGIVGILCDTPQDWKAGQRHHVAFTWRGREMHVYADGKLIGSRTQPLPLTGSLGGVKLSFGAEGRRSPIVIHALRVSTVARTAEQLTDAAPKADIATLLLDDFSNPPANADRTDPAVISAMSTAPGGMISKDTHWSKQLSGLAMYAAPN